MAKKPLNPNHESFSIRSRVASLPQELPKEKGPGPNLALWATLIAVPLLVVGVAWGATTLLSGNPHLARIEELREQLAPDKNLTDEQRHEVFSEMRKESEQLTDEQRRELWRSREDDMMQRFEKKLDDYFAMTPEQQVAALDEEIDEDVKRSEEWAKRRAEWEARRAAEEASGEKKADGGGTSGGGSGGDAQRSSRGGGPDGRSGRGDGGSRGPRTDKSRVDSRKRMLDRTSAPMRAKMAQYRQDMDKRRLERGLPPSTRRF